MLSKNSKKMTEKYIKEMQSVDGIYLQDELLEMQNVIEEIKLNLQYVDSTKIEMVDQLIQVVNTILDQISVNMKDM